LEKIVQVQVENVRIEEINSVVEKPVIVEKIKEVEKVVPYISEKIKEIELFKEKIVPIKETVESFREVPTYV